MIQMRTSEAAGVLPGELLGGDARFEGCGTDSRSIRTGELFVALRGPNFDGHRFVADASVRGAAAAMVSERDEYPMPAVLVPDTRTALLRLSEIWRSRFNIPIAAITGSNGKTTVKEMLASILSTQGPVLATLGNLNNEIGVPLTLLRLDSDCRYAVLELGANHRGEIEKLARVVKPKVGVITQCAPAHLEGFGSVEAVARAKGELIEQVVADGIAIINADDEYASRWRSMCGSRACLTFGLDRPADVSARWSSEVGRTRVVLLTPEGTGEVDLPLPGRHNVMNALAACAAALAFDISIESICCGLGKVHAIRGRLQPLTGPYDSQLIDDTYNANPASLKAGLEVLSEYSGAHWLVLGDMSELGVDEMRFHRDAGKLARRYGVTRLYATGERTRGSVDAFGENAYHFDDPEALAEALRGDLGPGITVLVKGSRSMRMERVVDALRKGS